jgi:hypothetical protein
MDLEDCLTFYPDLEEQSTYKRYLSEVLLQSKVGYILRNNSLVDTTVSQSLNNPLLFSFPQTGRPQMALV